jgi:hypothetical protein
MKAPTTTEAGSTGPLMIDLGGGLDYLAPLYAPGEAPNAAVVAAAIEHWFGLTLVRDGYTTLSAKASVTAQSGSITVSAPAGSSVPESAAAYATVLPAFLRIGWNAWTTVVPQLIKDKRWDPAGTKQWFFFLPHGLPMLNYVCLQFFHYPPLRLLQQRDYLHDPVPVRWGELLHACGVALPYVPLFERYIDGAPIAAPDDQGIHIPIDAFATYQQEMLRLFLAQAAERVPGYTQPVVVFGIPAMAQFERLFGVNLDILVPMSATTTLAGHTTPVLGATHPYHFYAQAQIDHKTKHSIGGGQMGYGCQLANMLQTQDLIAALWQVLMSENPGLDGGEMLAFATQLALDPSYAPIICALTAHQGSLWYPNPEPSLEFRFKLSLEAATKQCATNGNPCAGLPAGPDKERIRSAVRALFDPKA